MTMDLSVSHRLAPLPNPLIAASGCFGYGVEYSDVVDLSTLGGVAVKGLFLAEREGHPPPRIVETPSGMLNAIGLQGIGVHRFVREKLPELRDRRAIVFVNICGTTIDEYVELARILSDAEGVAALELNISCPNIKEGGITFGCSLTGTHAVVSAVRKVTTPAGHPEADAERHRRRVVRAGGGRGGRGCRVARQHVPGDGDRRRNPAPEAVEHRRRAERPGDPADRGAHGLRVPAGGEAADHRHGRHRTAADVLEFMIAGATAVQVGTANFVDPFIWRTLIEGLRAYMERHGHRAPRRPDGQPRHCAAGTGVDQLLVALDVEDGAAAIWRSADNLRGVVGGFKIGSRLFTTEGPAIVRDARRRNGDRVFLDLKFHDIPNTVATAVAAATSLGVWMVNVHASGGTRMMQAARDAAHETAARERRQPPLVIAVTVLTSMNEAMLDETGVHDAGPRSGAAACRSHAGGRPRRRRRLAAGDAADSETLRTGLRDRDAGYSWRSGRRRRDRNGQRARSAARLRTTTRNERWGRPKPSPPAPSYIVVGRPIIAAANARRAAEEIARVPAALNFEP